MEIAEFSSSLDIKQTQKENELSGISKHHFQCNKETGAI